MQSIHCLPPAPVISRFVAPWDTSGWYYVSPCFSNGSRLYSNADIYAAGAPGFLLGCEWIVTYDSHAEGFDDKQGVCFHVERPARIYVALDARVSPSFLSGFSDSGLRMSNSLGDVLCLYTRNMPPVRRSFFRVSKVRATIIALWRARWMRIPARPARPVYMSAGSLKRIAEARRAGTRMSAFAR